ncbi:MAG: hypothetical protein KDD33_02725 [Bdellovibrionales bacterium]|nr:hypothetical protein [Bdellovibrionales bacterium]
MNSKIGNSGIPARALNIREKTSNVQTNDPLKMKKEFDGKSLDQILNQVADPNFKHNPQRVKGHGNADLGKDAFFKLMLTQLKQQDPTNPLKSHEMAAQLAQFTSVEQLSNMNETLGKMANGSEKGSKYDVLNLIGKIVGGDSGTIDRMKGDKEHVIGFNLPKDAERAVIEIKDDKGTLIKKYELTELKQGKNQIIWNGLGSDGSDANVGQYQAEITAFSKGQKIKADTQFKGAVDGVKFTGQGPQLIVDGKVLNLKDVKTIEVNKMKKDKQVNTINPNSQISKGAKVAKQTANLEQARMDSDLKEKLIR